MKEWEPREEGSEEAQDVAATRVLINAVIARRSGLVIQMTMNYFLTNI